LHGYDEDAKAKQPGVVGVKSGSERRTCDWRFACSFSRTWQFRIGFAFFHRTAASVIAIVLDCLIDVAPVSKLHFNHSPAADRRS
jgi:hypothetical protein